MKGVTKSLWISLTYPKHILIVSRTNKTIEIQKNKSIIIKIFESYLLRFLTTRVLDVS